MTKTHNNMDSHLYRNVHDEKPYNKKWVVIRTEMCLRKTHTKTIWIVIRTKMCMTKFNTKTYANMDIQSTKLYMTKHTTELIQLVK